MTINSLASVSLHPPLLSLCVDHQADLHDLLLAAPVFVVNVLESRQEALSRRFADQHEDRFDGVGYRLSPEGWVFLDGVLAHIVCASHARHPGGDHTILVGRVIGGEACEGRPLLYYRGGYAALD